MLINPSPSVVVIPLLQATTVAVQVLVTSSYQNHNFVQFNLENPFETIGGGPIKMLSCTLAISVFPIITINKLRLRQRQTVVAASIHDDSLRVLEWDKLCDLVSSFATTSLGRQSLKVSLSISLPLVFLLLFHSRFYIVVAVMSPSAAVIPRWLRLQKV